MLPPVDTGGQLPGVPAAIAQSPSAAAPAACDSHPEVPSVAGLSPAIFHLGRDVDCFQALSLHLFQLTEAHS